MIRVVAGRSEGMHDGTLIYGATGYTGGLIVGEALARGLRPVVAGRSRSRIDALASTTGLEGRAFALEEAGEVLAGLAGISCVLNAAGPFSATWRAMVDACVAAGCHYADVTGEIGVFEGLAARDVEATEAGIALVPGVGFDVVPSDCLLAYLASRVDGVERLRLVVQGTPAISRGTARTILEGFGRGTAVRKDGRIEWLAEPPVEPADDAGLEGTLVGISYGDVSTAWYSTGAPDVGVFVAAGRARGRFAGWAFGRRHERWLRLAASLLGRSIGLMRPGPMAAEPDGRAGPTLIGDAWGRGGTRAAASMTTPDVYGLTAATAAEALRRLSRGEVAAGFHTPYTAFGVDFALEFTGVVRSTIRRGPADEVLPE